MPRLLTLALLLPLAGCGLLRPAGSPPGDAVLVLINRAEVPVRSVYLAPCESGGWGPDRLDAGEVVMPRASRAFALEPGCWNTRAVFDDDRAAEERGVEMTTAGQRTWTLAEPEG